jgi:catechol 2,3-dioxygenase
MNTSEPMPEGAAANGDPATPGSYGLAPDGFRLPGAMRLGPVRLQVGDLSRSLDFYSEVLGLAVLERRAGHARLGTSEGSILVELEERPGARASRSRGRTGLFHFALLVPDRPALGRFLRHLGSIGVHPGAADHLVSEALYLQDPDNLGIEVYRDRARADWRRSGRELRMATDPLDFDGVMAAGAAAPWQGISSGTVLGHVHLHVGDLELAAAFYAQALGLDRTVWSYPGALFLAAGGYHHHLGINIWEGRGASAPGADEAQLLEWTIELPGAADLERVRESLERSGFPPASRETSSFVARDPWGTRLRLRAGTSG